MPVYRIISEDGHIEEADRPEVARAITDLHIQKAGGLPAFVKVVFEDYGAGHAYAAGKRKRVVIVSGTIRAGRSRDAKEAMLHGLRDVFFDIGIAKDELVVGLEDIEAANALEFGHVMPEVGEEAAWLEKTGIMAD